MKSVILLTLALSMVSAQDLKFECLKRAFELHQSTASSRSDYDLRNLLTMYSTLNTNLQEQIKACSLSLAPALARCERSYGVGACDQLSPAAIQVKCDERFLRVGCCHCGMKCPTGWTESEYHCTKPASVTKIVYSSIAACSGQINQICEEVSGKWVPICGVGLKRIAISECIAVCPLGWHDEGHRCRKPANYRLTQPFLWTVGDN